MSFSSNDATKTAFPVLDMMLQMQRLGLQAMTMYQPMAAAMLSPARRGAAFAGERRAGVHTEERHVDTGQEQVLALGEEVLNVGTRMVPGKRTRVRRVVIESPVQKDVTLHTETVILEHRKPIATNGTDVLTEVTVEMTDFNEVPVVTKDVRLVEEVLLRREVTARTETIRDTIRRDTIEVEQPSQVPALFSGTNLPANVGQNSSSPDQKSADAEQRTAGADQKAEQKLEKADRDLAGQDDRSGDAHGKKPRDTSPAAAQFGGKR